MTTEIPDNEEDMSADDLQALNVDLQNKIQLLKRKDINQGALAWAAMISMTLVTGLLFCPRIPDTRITILKDILDLYYVTQASIIGMYMGAKAFMNRK